MFCRAGHLLVAFLATTLFASLAGCGSTSSTSSTSPKTSEVGSSIWQPVWSPDAASIAWISERDSNTWVSSADGTKARPITNSADPGQLAWLSNGELLLQSGYKLYRLRFNGHRTFVGTTGLNFATGKTARWVPDDASNRSVRQHLCGPVRLSGSRFRALAPAEGRS